MNIFKENLFYYKLEIVLLVLTIIGLILKFFKVFYKAELNSDYATQGLITVEFWKYHNYLLSYFYVPSDDSYTFDEIIHLLPQFLSNYNPLMLKMVSFSIFLLTIIIFSYIIFFWTKSLTNSLFFSAILSNWYILYGVLPHDSTVLMIGILLILYIFKPIKKWEILFLTILAITTFSDSLILVWFTIPIIIIHFSNRFREQVISFLKFDMTFKIVSLSSIIMVFKKIFIEYYISHTNIFHCRELNCLNSQVSLFLKDLSSLFLYRLADSGPMSSIELFFVNVLIIFLIIFLIIYMILLIKDFRMEKMEKMEIRMEKIEKMETRMEKIKFLKFVGIMSIITSLFYITTATPGTLRYLLFILICILSIFCMVDFKKLKYAKWVLLSIILFNMIFVIESASINVPNDEQYKLIDFLRRSNLSFGYGEYWDANIITYLSQEDVIIRPALIDNGLKPFLWNSAQRWYENPPKNFFIIVRKTNEKAINMYNYIYPEPVKIIDYENYKIFEYNTSNFSRILNARLFFHSGGVQEYDYNIQGTSWYADKNFEGYIIYGPYVSLPEGNYKTTYMIKTDMDTSKNISLAKLEIFDDKILKQITIYSSDFKNKDEKGGYMEFTLDFTSQNNKDLQFRVYKYPNSTLNIGNIILNKLNT